MACVGGFVAFCVGEVAARPFRVEQLLPSPSGRGGGGEGCWAQKLIVSCG
jgi:hypothetical protein